MKDITKTAAWKQRCPRLKKNEFQLEKKGEGEGRRWMGESGSDFADTAGLPGMLWCCLNSFQ